MRPAWIRWFDINLIDFSKVLCHPTYFSNASTKIFSMYQLSGVFILDLLDWKAEIRNTIYGAQLYLTWKHITIRKLHYCLYECWVLHYIVIWYWCGFHSHLLLITERNYDLKWKQTLILPNNNSNIVYMEVSLIQTKENKNICMMMYAVLYTYIHRLTNNLKERPGTVRVMPQTKHTNFH